MNLRVSGQSSYTIVQRGNTIRDSELPKVYL